MCGFFSALAIFIGKIYNKFVWVFWDFWVRQNLPLVTTHILRAVYSDMTRQNLADNLQEGEGLVTADWAQKYEPIYLRERQDQYFGKRGTPWHITHVIARISGKLVQHTFVHVTPGEIQVNYFHYHL